MDYFIEDLNRVFSLGSDGLKSAYLSLQGLAFFITLALALILAIAYIIVKTKAPDKLKIFKTLTLGIVIGYAVTLTICISFFMIARLSVKEETDVNFYLMLGFFALCFVYALSTIFTRFLSKKVWNIVNLIGIGLLVAYGIVLICVLPTINEPLSTAGMYCFTFAIIIVIAALTILFGKDGGSANQTKSIAYAGVCIAIAFALSYIKLFSMPQGGSVTLASMLPIIIYAYVFGARKGVMVGVIYGLLQFLQSPQVYQPLQVLLDYPVAFGALGVAGIVKNLKFLKKPIVKFIFAVVLSCLLRYFSHVISGVYVFYTWAAEGYSAVAWGFVGNLYVLVEIAILLVVGCALFSSKSLVKQIDNINPRFEKSKTEEQTSTEETK